MVMAQDNPKGILVFESDKALESLLLEVIREYSMDILIAQATSVYEIQQAAVSEACPEIMILDLEGERAGADLVIDLKTSHPLMKILLLLPAILPDEFGKVARLNSVHFLSKPFSREQFLGMMLWLMKGPKPGSRGLFKVHLEGMLLLDLLHLKCFSGASTQFDLVSEGGEKGRLVIEKGQIIHAQAGVEEGIQAFQLLAAWKGGEIKERALLGKVKPTIDKDFQLLLFEATRVLDEKIIEECLGTSSAMEEGEGSFTRMVQNREVDEENLGHFESLAKVVVVDDSPLVLRFVEQVLGRSFPDLAVVTVETGQEGLDCVREYQPELIILDYVLPDFNGEAFCRALLEDAVIGSIPVIIMSGLHSHLQSLQGKHANILSVLEKPFTEERLIEEARRGLALKSNLM
jgi:DNA-binding response OmpR family regulator